MSSGPESLSNGVKSDVLVRELQRSEGGVLAYSRK